MLSRRVVLLPDDRPSTSTCKDGALPKKRLVRYEASKAAALLREEKQSPLMQRADYVATLPAPPLGVVVGVPSP